MPTSDPTHPTRILFSGYAQVHVVSFMPLYRELAKDPNLEIWFTGGFRKKDGRGHQYIQEGFFDPFDVPEDRIIPYSDARNRSYHILFCSHLSQTLTPKHADVRIELFHGVSFKNAAVTAKALKYDYLFLAGPYMRRRFIDQGLFAPHDPRLVMTGFAKVDRLVDGTLKREDVLDGLGLDPSLETIIFAPTGGKKNALELHGTQIIESLVAEGRYNLLIKPHDHPKDTSYDWRSILRGYEGDRVRAIWDPDITPYLLASDLLITDASSVANEYAILDRPIVFIDVPELLAKLEEKGLPVDLATWGRKGGVTLQDPADLPATVRGLLFEDLDGGSETRRALAQDIFFEPGTATGRCVAAVREIISLLDSPDRKSGPVPLKAATGAPQPASSTTVQ